MGASVNLNPLAKMRSPAYELVARKVPFTYRLPLIVEVAFVASVVVNVKVPFLPRLKISLVPKAVEELMRNELSLDL